MKKISIVGLFVSMLFCLQSTGLGSSKVHNTTTDRSACETNTTGEYLPSPKSSTIKAIGVAFWISVTILAILCNALIIHVVRANKHMHTTTNYLIVNMAVGDTLAAILTSGITLYNAYNGNSWSGDLLFGEHIYCRMICPLYYLCMLCSIYSLVVLTFDRFLAVTRPLKYQHHSSSTKYMIPCVWITSVAVATHYALREIVFCSNGGKFYCIPQASPLQAFLKLSLGFVLPHLIILIQYMAIAYTLCTRKVPGEHAQKVSGQTEKVAKKVTLMIVCIFVAFDVAYVPFYLGFVFPFLYYGKAAESFLEVWSCKLLVTFNGVFNVIIYAVFNESFKHAFQKALPFGRFLKSVGKLNKRLAWKCDTSSQKTSNTGLTTQQT